MNDESLVSKNPKGKRKPPNYWGYYNIPWGSSHLYVAFCSSWFSVVTFSRFFLHLTMHRIVVIMIITSNTAPTLAPMIKPMLFLAGFGEGGPKQVASFGIHGMLFPSYL